jgi:hypothetical protein
MTERPKPNPLLSILQRLEKQFNQKSPLELAKEAEEFSNLKYYNLADFQRKMTKAFSPLIYGQRPEDEQLIPFLFALLNPLDEKKYHFSKEIMSLQISHLLDCLENKKNPFLTGEKHSTFILPAYLILRGLKEKNSYWLLSFFSKLTPAQRKEIIQLTQELKNRIINNLVFWDINLEKQPKEKLEEILSKTLNFEELEEYENYLREIRDLIQRQIEEDDKNPHRRIRTTIKEYQNQILFEIPRNQVEKDLKDIVQQRDKTPQTEEEKDDFFEISYLLSKDLEKIGLSKDQSGNIILTMSDKLTFFSSDTFEKYLKPILGHINQNDVILITLISKLSSDNPKTANFSWLFVDKNEKKGYRKRRKLIAAFSKTLKDLFTRNSDLRNYLDTFFVQSIEGKYPDSDPFYKVLAAILYQHYENKKTIKNETLSKEIFDNFIKQPGVAEALLALRKIYLGVLLTENLEYFPKDESDENKPIINPDVLIFSFDDERKMKEMRENKQLSSAYLQKLEQDLIFQIIYLLLEKNFFRNKLEVTKTTQENEISITVSSDSIGDDGCVTIKLGGEEIKVSVVIESENQLKFSWKNVTLGSIAI